MSTRPSDWHPRFNNIIRVTRGPLGTGNSGQIWAANDFFDMHRTLVKLGDVMRKLIRWQHDAPEDHCDVLLETYGEFCRANEARNKAHEDYHDAKNRYGQFKQVNREEPRIAAYEVFQERLTDAQDAVAIAQGNLNVANEDRESARAVHEMAIKGLSQAWLDEASEARA